MTIAGDQAIVEIDENKVLRDIGYNTNREPPARMRALVREYAQNAGQLINPLYSYAIRDIELVVGSSVVIEGGVTFESEVISGLLTRCERVAVFALTIDGYLEEKVRQLTDEGFAVQARVLDAIGSDAAERVAEHVQDMIARSAAAMGLTTSRRFSPGYCDWDVSQQQMLFHTMNGNSAFVELTEECLMVPRKSISGIVGIGTTEGGVKSYNPCRSCRRGSCPGRR